MKRFLLLLPILSALNLFAQVKINWLTWSENTFAKAKAESKPVFVDVGTEWCTACNLMEEKTYIDSLIIKTLNKNFICIKADAEAQPDVGARFLEWGWPALIFLDSNGNQLQAYQGNRRPEMFIEILNEFLKEYKAGNLKIQNNDFFSSEPPDKSGLKDIFEKSYKQLDYYYDSLYYGWGYVLKIPLYQPVELSFWLNKNKKGSRDISKALNSLNQYSKISDRKCGGVYFGCSSGRSWKGAQPEKRTEYQAGVMNNYAEAFMATRNEKWINEAHLIDYYLQNFMYSKEDGLFYNSQEEYIDLKDLSKVISPEKYFTLSASERAVYGFPPIDKTIYTDINFRLVKAYLKLYEAFQRKEDLQMAINTANQLCKKALLPQGYFKTVVANKNLVQRMRELPSDSSDKNIMYLKPQLYAGLSMLQLYQFTQDSIWLQRCKNLINIVNEKLRDKENGGYFSTDLQPVSLGGKEARTKVLSENSLFARFLIEYSDLTEDEKAIKDAEVALRSVAVEKILGNEERLIGDFVLAAHKLIKHHLVFTVVSTDFNSKETRELLKMITHYYHPAKLIKLEKPGNYPDMGKPALFVCNKTVCSQPILYPGNVLKEIDGFIKKLK